MGYQHPDNETIVQALKDTKKIAVIGLSDKEYRTSYQIAKEMQDAGYRIIPVNPMVDQVLGEKAYDSLLDVKESFEMINVFRRSEHLPSLAEEAVKTDAKIFWAQQGVQDDEAYEYLKKHDFTVMMDMCLKVAHAVLMK
ncbi:CoA-binding protein [Thalassobacillus devorans]|uniref:CoA-binding protein n=1 Tax=Thalassobacillus devorans TaxID=279813 RepID=A0ABQ1P472_9BACI|nr:CoA-binding protein [Thalassobacillus devorans]NIK28120.1 putative CoA-binding protein [Thalassobacillus devorans]GGC88731.1 CoA-binding protein [Thalassobacillus devorans]